MLPGLTLAFEPPFGIRERAGGAGQDEVHVRLEGGERAHDVVADLVEGYAPFERRRSIGGSLVDQTAQLVENASKVIRLLFEETFDGRAEISARPHLSRGDSGRGALRRCRPCGFFHSGIMPRRRSQRLKTSSS